MTHFRASREVNMTQGSIVRHLILFALPLLAGNVFQQLYNTVDSWIVSWYVGDTAFAAVGSVGPIVNMLVGTFMGLASGAGVVISQYFGAKKEEQVRQAVHTALLLTLILSVVFTAIGLLCTPALLRLMKTPDTVFPLSKAYLTIYFGGMVTMLVYNMGSGILRAVGDSRRPFYYLVVSAVLNILLDLLFVLRFHMGVQGVAWATVISQGVSAVLVIVTLLCAPSCVRLIPRMLRLNRVMLGKIVRVGLPAAVQMAVTAFSNVFVQSYINRFGEQFMEGWTAYSKIDLLALLPMQSLSLAATTFMGQNLGVGDVKRAKRGVHIALLISEIVTLILIIPMEIFAPALTRLFTETPQVVEYGALLLRIISPFYLLCCVNQIYAGALRGAGNGTAPMVIMLFSFVLFRQVYLYLVSRFIGGIIPVALGYPVGWVVCSILMVIYFHHISLLKTSVVTGEEA